MTKNKHQIYILCLLFLLLKPAEVFSQAEIYPQIYHKAQEIKKVIFTPEGKSFLTVTNNNIKKWDRESGRLISTFSDYLPSISNVALSPDGRYIAAIDASKSIIIRDISDGRIITRIRSQYVNGEIAFTQDSQSIVLTAGLLFFDIQTGKEIKKLSTPYGYTTSRISLSPDMRFILCGGTQRVDGKESKNGVLILYELNTFKEVRRFTTHTGGILSVVISPDSKYAASSSYDKSIRVWELATGKEVLLIDDHEGLPLSLEFSKDSRSILSTDKNKVVLNNILTGEETLSYSYNQYLRVSAATFSPDGKTILSANNSIYINDSVDGHEIQSIKNNISLLSEVSLSPDDSTVFYALGDMPNASSLRSIDLIRGEQRLQNYEDTTKIDKDSPSLITKISNDGQYAAVLKLAVLQPNILIYNARTGEYLFSLPGHFPLTTCIDFSPDSQYLVSGGWDEHVTLWNLKDRTEKFSVQAHSGNVHSVSFSHDGRYIVSGANHEDPADGDKTTLFIWNAENGDEILRFADNELSSRSVRFSPDGRFIASASFIQKGVKLWDSRTGELIRRFDGHQGQVNSVEFSNDGKRIITGGSDGIVIIWDVSSGAEITRSKPFQESVNNAKFTKDGSRVIVTSAGWSLLNASDLSPIITHYSFIDGEWITITEEGYYAASEGGGRYLNVKKGSQVYGIDQFFETFYRPDLVRAKLAGDDISSANDSIQIEDLLEPVPLVTLEMEHKDGFFSSDISSFSDLKINDGTVRVRVTAVDQGGGVHDIRLFHNGVRSTGYSRGLAAVQKSNSISRIFNISPVAGLNTLNALAFSTKRIESRNVSLDFQFESEKIVEPVLWLFSIGINEYKNPRYNLNYAVDDAKSFINVLKSSGSRLFKDIRVTFLSDRDAGKNEIISTFETIQQQSNPEDVFVFFFAGHGIALDNDKSVEFFFIPTDITQMTDLNQVMNQGISGLEFESLVSGIPARKQFLILDACNSGAINEAFGIRGAAEEKALSRLSRSTGSALIAASREDQFAQEFKSLGQGALTQVLLDGLNGGASHSNGEITVGSLKSYVESNLPELTEKYSGQVQYPTGFIFGQDFPIALK